MFEYLPQVVNNELYFWTVLAYLIILYHTFNIKEIQEKLQGVELLFISIAVGTLLFFIHKFLTPLFFALQSWMSSLKSASTILPLTNNPFGPEVMPAESYFIGYFTLGIGIFLFGYLVLVYSSFAVVKIIQFCFDPNKTIFVNYRRFTIFTKNRVAEILLFGIPRLAVGFIFLLIMIGLVIGFVVNIPNLSFDLLGMINLIIALIMLLLSVGMMVLFGVIVHKDLIMIKPIVVKLNKMLQVYRQNMISRNKSRETDKINAFFDKYINHGMYLMLFFMSLMASRELMQKQDGYYGWLLIIASSIAMAIFIYIKARE